jgi:membrane-associated phospholipid phosphatase
VAGGGALVGLLCLLLALRRKRPQIDKRGSASDEFDAFDAQGTNDNATLGNPLTGSEQDEDEVFVGDYDESRPHFPGDHSDIYWCS